MSRSASAVAVAAVAAVAALAAQSPLADLSANDIGVVGGSIPADGRIPAEEVLPAFVEGGGNYGLGRPATAADVAAWDIDVRYDGEGLPAGSGSVEAGAAVYDQKCALCHGDFGQGEGRWPVLSGGFDSLTDQGGATRPEKTVGSYWPYAPSLYDYVRRTMPYTEPQSLSDEETYAVVAYLLFLNDLVEEEFVATKESLSAFVMPNRDNFYPDPRPDVAAVACMEGCLDEDTLALVETIKGVTPVDHLRTPEAMSAAATAAADESPSPAVVAHYEQFCALCHDSGVADAPRLDDAAGWQARLGQSGGEQAIIQSAITGKGAMPPKGGALHLSDDEVAAIVRYMLGK